MANIPYKLLVVDIDGTLLNKDGAISTEDKKALSRASDSGIQVSLSTGRVTQACSKILKQLSLDGYHMFFDGALVSNPETSEEVYCQPIGEELVRQIVEFAHLKEINVDLYSATRYFIERETWTTDIRRNFFNLQPTVVDLTDIWHQERIIKGTLVVFSAEEKAKADSFRSHFDNRLSFSLTNTPAYPGIDFINVVDSEVSKGKAMEALASFLGISVTEVMAIGDGANDVSLLSKAGLAIAMGNASDELKAVADYVTLDVDHNGVAAAIERFILQSRRV
ncbi:Cof-type HAD-IIB family hydrolase [Chloroflexota bacterium]